MVAKTFAPDLVWGCIFGVFKASSVDSIKSGRDMVASAYSVFGATMQFARVSSGSKPTLEQYINGEWVVTCKELSVQQTMVGDSGYSINEGYSELWDKATVDFVNSCKGMSQRWMGCMVSDVHRCILTASSFLYPTNTKQP